MNGHDRPSSRNDFEIAIICALPLENNAVLCSLDEVWLDAPTHYGLRRAEGDESSYVFGRSGRHAVVVVVLPRMGKAASSTAAQSLKMSFPLLNLVLLVGICGAVPKRRDGVEIILGDVIISEVLVELDHGRQYHDGFRRRQDTVWDAPRPPTEEVLSLLQRFKTPILLSEMHRNTARNLEKLLEHEAIRTTRPPASQDRLYPPDYIHRHHSGCLECSAPGMPEAVCDAALTTPCEALGCDESILVPRNRLVIEDADNIAAARQIQIHFGSIGTGDTVMKSAKHRDQHAGKELVIAFEMEGAGVWNKFNCLIIKGVCDYADSHKNKKWQEYAAAVAASAAKEVLGHYIPHDRRSGSRTPDSRSELLSRTSTSFRGQLDSQIFPAIDDSLPKDIFNRMLKRVEKRFDADRIVSFKETDLRALKRELKRIQEEQERTRTLRNMRRIEQFVEKIDQFGQVLETIIGTSEPINLIWGPVKVLLHQTKNQPDLFDTLLSAYEDIGVELPNFGDHVEVFRHNVGLQRVLARLFADVTEFHENAMRLYFGRALKVVFRPLWKDFHTPKFDNIVKRIRSHTELIEDKARASYANPGQYNTDIQGLRDHLRRIEEDALKLKDKEAERQETKLKEVQDWIAGTESETEHNNICRDRHRYPNSGNWILEQGRVKEWLVPDPDQSYSSMLWINGRPGTGKTYLASVLVEACMKDTSWLTCYFYCNEKVESKTSALAIMRGILLQLIHLHRELVPYCHSRMKNSRTPTLSDLSIAHSIIETFCERIPRLYMIIDGLDECEDGRRDAIETFKNLIRKTEGYAPGKLRVLFLSRPLPEIKREIPDAAILALGPEHNKEDIERYCQRRTRELEKFDFSEAVLANAVKRICIRADGMFLFAKLVMNNLAKQSTIGRFWSEISDSRLPNELDEAYTRIVERLKDDLLPEQLEYTRLLLGWLVCSKRPLKWTEIQLALSINMEALNTNELDMDLKLVDDPEELCGSLVQVLKGNRIELVHSTARQFIAKTREISLATAECDLTLRCLRYLTLDVFKQNIATTELQRYALRGDLAFQDYAVASWFLHMKTLVESKQAFLDGDAMSVEQNSNSQVVAITRIFSNFASFYDGELPETILDQSRKDCEFFQRYPFYDDLIRIWDHICAAQRGDLEARNNVSLPSLKDTLTRNRTLLENLSNGPNIEIDFSSLYDDSPFRCPKVMCFYFHEGFKRKETRDSHVNYHDMPFHCTVESCAMRSLGFRSNNDLTKHNKRYHPEEVDLGESFTNLSRREVVPTRWECPQCHKFFVRRNILEDHKRSHKGEKPFCCSECGKGFARKSDMKRHEKIHERRKR
ncbi:uncharacterized protein BDV17DRAFT_264698 [Aspergillus undulatus]|uniref:uncharacterized protein n=1 Tax=Aspergillus undulatus TaxID=1810928 RepID=UPI003CCDD37B